VANKSDATENGVMSLREASLKPVMKRHTQASEIERLREELADERDQRIALQVQVAKLTEGMRAIEQMLGKRIQEQDVEIRDLKEKAEADQKTIAWFRKQMGCKEESLPDSAVLELDDNEPGSSKANEPEAKGMNEPTAAQTNEPRSLKNNEPGARGANEPNAVNRPKGQQSGSKGHGRTNRKEVPVSEIIIKEIEGGCACKTCGKQYTILPEVDSSKLLEIMVWLHQVQYDRLRYAPQCNCDGNKIETAPPVSKLYPRTTIGNSLWVYLVTQKFLHGIPTNRTLKYLSLNGVQLAHGTVIGGFKIIDRLVEPLYDEIVRHCQGCDFWNGDETTWRIFDAEKIQWWLWVMASMDSVVYILDPTRSKEVPADFFGGSAGTLMTDRLASYKKLSDDIKKAWCWIHQRRDIFKIFEGVPVLKGWAQEWLEEIAQLFVFENDRHVLWRQGRTTGTAWETAQKRLEEHVQHMQERWQNELKRPKLHKLQKQALRSLKRHWEGLTIFLKDPRIPLHNNRAERLIRNSVILRKNSYGSGTAWAGHFAAKIFTLMQTWLINGLNPEALLLDYFEACSQTSGKPPPDLAPFLPWTMSEERKQHFALPPGYRRPG